MGKSDRKRSRSRERKTRDRSSSSEAARRDKKKKRRQSSSDSDSDDFQDNLDKQRVDKARTRKLEKLRLKENETPEEKRARRMAKKLKKEEKRKRKQEESVPQIAYTNMNNPFNDANLTETFVWKKKHEQEGRGNVSKAKLEKETRERIEKNWREMEELKRVRDARQAAREDMEMIQRDADRKAHGDWSQKEVEFQLRQAKERSKLRIDQNRAKAIDLLSRYILFGDPIDESERESEKFKEFELCDPLTYLKDLRLSDFEDVIEDIKVYRQLEGSKHDSYWNDIRIIVSDEIRKLNSYGERGRSAIHESVQDSVNKLIKGKSVTQLCELEDQIRGKIYKGGSGTDTAFWESMIEHLKVVTSKARLRELHQQMLKLKLKRIREEQMKELGDLPASTSQSASTTDAPMERPRPVVHRDLPSEDLNDTAELEKKLRPLVDVDEIESNELDDMQREHRWRQLNPEELEFASLALYKRGGYSPAYGDVDDAMPGIEVLEEAADEDNLASRRQQNRKRPDDLTQVEAAMVAIARKGMEGDESTFSVEQPLDTQKHLWSDKYRPRKPTYLNRVQTGFDWNKYNQTHYDMDNPPPKIVQGYKFNIFYPDLLDVTKTPSFTVTPCDDKDFCVIRFHSGPPYEDIAFKCVNREWEVNHKNGYKCQFQNGVFQLWFVFKKYRYRR